MVDQLPPRRRARRHAIVREDAANAIAVKLGAQIRDLARRLGQYDADLGQAILDSLHQMADIGRQWIIDNQADQPVDEGAGGRELTTHEVAKRLRVSVRRVTKLIEEDLLAARKSRGRWLVEEQSLVLYEQRRRQPRSA